MIGRAANKFHSLWLSHTYPFSRIGKGVSIDRSCEIRRDVAKYISIGKDVIIEKDVWIHIEGIPSDGKPVVVLDDGCVIGRNSVISAKNHIYVGRHVLFGPSVLVMDHNHEFEDFSTPIKFQGTTPGGTISIEEGAWVGFGGAIVSDAGELAIGRNAVIGANSFVTGSVAPYTVVVGNPGRPIKHFDPVRQAWLIGGRTLKSAV
jgi:acetyltransferase-like isoleucine patch superfamily enzyme